jgi:hypothetical protein
MGDMRLVEITWFEHEAPKKQRVRKLKAVIPTLDACHKHQKKCVTAPLTSKMRGF